MPKSEVPVLETGLGFARGENAFAAGADAAQQAVQAQLHHSLTAVLVFASIRYDLEALLEGVHSVTGEVPTLGATTAGEICNGVHKESVVVVTLASPYLSIKVGVGREVSRDWSKAVKDAVDEGPVSDYFRSDNEEVWRRLRQQGTSAFSLLFSPGNTKMASSRSHEILMELKGRSQDMLPIFGGSAADDWKMEDNYVLHGRRAYRDSVLVAVFETQLRFGLGLAHGFKPTSRRATVTRVREDEGHEAVELDGRPAAEVYAELLGKPQSELEGKHLTLTTGRPAGTPDAFDQYSINVASYFTSGGGVRFAQPVVEGTCLTIMDGDADDLVEAGRLALKRAIQRGAITDPATVLVFSCALRTRILGERTGEEISRLTEMVPGSAVAGFYSFGEQGIGIDGVERHNNEVVTLLALGNELSAAAETALENERLLEERRQIQKEVVQREQESNLVFDNAPVAMILVDEERRVVKANRMVRDVYGPKKRSPVIRAGDALRCVNALGSKEGCGFGQACRTCGIRLLVLDTLQNSKHHYREEHRLEVDRGGEITHLHFLVSSVPLAMEGSSCALLALEDISLLKHAQEQFRLASKASSDLIYEWDVQTDTLDWYGDMEGMLGYAPGEIPRTISGWINLIHPEDRSPMKEAVEVHRLSSQPIHYEYRIRQKDGTWRYWIDRGVPQIGADGKNRRWIGACTDITEKKNLEEQLLQAQKMEAIGNLAGGIAHDFNNLLHAILGNMEIVLSDIAVDERYRREIGEAHKAASRAADMTRQLLAFSRRQVLQPTALNLNDLIADLMNMLPRLLGEHIDLEFVPGLRLGLVHADRSQIEQVILNLCINARDALVDGGNLTIATQDMVVDGESDRDHPSLRPGRYSLMTVTDNGQGMDRETLDRIFEPFYTTKEVGKGTGLGLATVFGIVQQHNGFIHASSELTGGTTFEVYLPATEEVAPPAVQENEWKAPRGRETILFAEDETVVRDLTTRVLEGAGYTVLTARDGEEALQVFEEHADEIHLAVLDVVMPKLGGHIVAARIIEKRPHLPVLFTSGYSENAVHNNFILEEGCLLIQKPFKQSELLHKIRETLGVRPEVPS